MAEIVSSLGSAYLVAAVTILVVMLVRRGDTAMLVGSLLLIVIAAAFLFTASNLETVLLYGTLPSTSQSSPPSVDVQRARIALWNIVVPLLIGGLGIGLFSNWVGTYMTRKSGEA